MPQWNLDIPQATDQSVRAYLASVGKAEEGLASFVVEAVRAELQRREEEAETKRILGERIASLERGEVGVTAGDTLAQLRDALGLNAD